MRLNLKNKERLCLILLYRRADCAHVAHPRHTHRTPSALRAALADKPPANANRPARQRPPARCALSREHEALGLARRGAGPARRPPWTTADTQRCRAPATRMKRHSLERPGDRRPAGPSSSGGAAPRRAGLPSPTPHRQGAARAGQARPQPAPRTRRGATRERGARQHAPRATGGRCAARRDRAHRAPRAHAWAGPRSR